MSRSVFPRIFQTFLFGDRVRVHGALAQGLRPHEAMFQWPAILLTLLLFFIQCTLFIPTVFLHCSSTSISALLSSDTFILSPRSDPSVISSGATVNQSNESIHPGITRTRRFGEIWIRKHFIPVTDSSTVSVRRVYPYAGYGYTPVKIPGCG